MALSRPAPPDADPVESAYLADGRGHVPLVGWVERTLARADVDPAKAAAHPHVRALLDGAARDALDRGDGAAARALVARSAPARPQASFDEADPWCELTRGLAELLGLTPLELAVLRLCDACHRSPALAELFGADATGSEPARRQCDAIAHALGAAPREVRRALDQRGSLRRRGILQRIPSHPANRTFAIEAMLRLSDELQDHVDERVAGLLGSDATPFVDRPPPARFELDAWPHLRGRLDGVARYLAASLEAGAAGANVLLWGAPGTGKTELARSLAAAAGAAAFAVRTTSLGGHGAGGHELGVHSRLDNFSLGTSIAATKGRTVVLFDETEDILGAEVALLGSGPEDRPSKGHVNAILESGGAPSVWIANSIDGIDGAYLRRFDVVLEVLAPPPAVRARMFAGALDGLELPDALAAALAASASVTPADVAKARRVVERSGAAASGRAVATLRETIDAELRSRGERRLVVRPASALGDADGSLASVDVPADEARALLAPGSRARLALVGPAGAGKSAWLRARALEAGRGVARCDFSALADARNESPQSRLRGLFERAAERDEIVHVERVEHRFDPRPEMLPEPQSRWALALIEELARHEGAAVLETRDARFAHAALPAWLDARVRFGPLPAAAIARAVRALCGHAPATWSAMDVHPGDLVAVERRLELGVLERRADAILEALRSMGAGSERGGAVGFTSGRG